MKQRVLIVDDIADIRLMLRSILENEGYVIVAEATNGQEAVEKYLEHLPDITIMDIEMPFKSGVEAAREILALVGTARIIFCSGSVTRQDIAALEMGMDGHNVVRKPFLPAQLFQEMAR
jgi:two-component system, chemotaxis family, chemotaxis protein CheY